MADQDNQTTCVFHLNCNSQTETVILFTDKTLKTCQEKLKIRAVCKLKCSDVVLPEAVNDSSGYHRSCSKLFTSLNSKNIEDYKKISSSAGTSDTSKLIL